MKFYDGVIQTVKNIHVKPFSKDQVGNILKFYVCQIDLIGQFDQIKVDLQFKVWATFACPATSL